ncbi:MAG: hypothetical protein AseanaTS_24560 [Candidatus Pelagadaptatus aseana]
MVVLKSSSRTVVLSLLACLAFIGAAIFAWGVPVSDITSILWLSLFLMASLVVAAALFMLLLKLGRRMTKRFKD